MNEYWCNLERKNLLSKKKQKTKRKERKWRFSAQPEKNHAQIRPIYFRKVS